MGRRVLKIVLLLVSGIVTVAVFAVAPIFTPTVLAAAAEAIAPAHACGGG